MDGTRGALPWRRGEAAVYAAKALGQEAAPCEAFREASSALEERRLSAQRPEPRAFAQWLSATRTSGASGDVEANCYKRYS